MLTYLIYVTLILVATALAASSLTRDPMDFLFDDNGAKISRNPPGRPEEQSFGAAWREEFRHHSLPNENAAGVSFSSQMHTNS